jgi:hypothetical protein
MCYVCSTTKKLIPCSLGVLESNFRCWIFCVEQWYLYIVGHWTILQHINKWNAHEQNQLGANQLTKLNVGVNTLPLLKNRHKKPLIHMPYDLHKFGSW